VYRNASLQPAARNAPCAAVEQRAAHTAAGVLWVNEQQEHLAFSRMDGGETDDIVQFIDGDEQNVRRRMVRHELVPLIRRKHRFPSEVREVRPAFANGSIEHCSDLLGIACDGWSNGGHKCRLHCPRRRSPVETAATIYFCENAKDGKFSHFLLVEQLGSTARITPFADHHRSS
jgi:hypothetical protein